MTVKCQGLFSENDSQQSQGLFCESDSQVSGFILWEWQSTESGFILWEWLNRVGVYSVRMTQQSRGLFCENDCQQSQGLFYENDCQQSLGLFCKNDYQQNQGLFCENDCQQSQVLFYFNLCDVNVDRCFSLDNVFFCNNKTDPLVFSKALMFYTYVSPSRYFIRHNAFMWIVLINCDIKASLTPQVGGNLSSYNDNNKYQYVYKVIHTQFVNIKHT